jgi:hypothetical protein
MSWLTCAIIGGVGILVIAMIALGIWIFTHSDEATIPTSMPGTVPGATLTLTPAETDLSETPASSATPVSPTLTPWPTNPPENQENGNPSPTLEGL